MSLYPPAVLQHAEKRIGEFSVASRQAGFTVPSITELPGDSLRVWACSDYVANNCIRHPAVLDDLIASGDLVRAYEAGTYREKIEAALEFADHDDAVMQGLRWCKRREMVRIGVA